MLREWGSSESDRARAVCWAINSTISENKDYAKMMNAYEQASDLLKQMEGSLVLGEVLKLLGIWRGASFACESATGFGRPSKGAPHGDEITCFAAHAGRVDGVDRVVVFPQFQRRTNWLSWRRG